jgi:heterodisulfide reductase subunit A-like polyferredoxin
MTSEKRHSDHGRIVHPAADTFGIPMDRPCVTVHAFHNGVCEDCGTVCDHDSVSWVEFPGEPRTLRCEFCGEDVTEAASEYNI